ncbi:helix-turn-helix domain-containing protein [Bosea sp. (in: a-proteobacteria)]|uniref:helix-turn-helix domain-containing protein n=1 Tax=Bosea sp. (in: a-proteobacteria) TaxID=1871050 RepID=UPI002603D6D6|nr:helix-turn-helix domain-containing protein [Bosea sp. (in: a-proteobacteria)]MCO5090877.1 helix-turn-helix domain-containing protein [Bosea sp. (in: a-proteobacteria)]
MSSRPPSIAGHPDRDQIDALLDAGASLRSIALTHGISKTTLIRYRDSRQPQADAAPSVRVRTRPAPQPQDEPDDDATEAPPCAPEECDHLTPTEARLRDVAQLLVQGYSREEIAARYRVTAGTVTDWHRKIKANGTALVHTVTAENIVATLLANSQQRSAMLARIAHRAEISAPRVAIAATDGLRKEDQHIAAMADTLGVLDRFPAQGRDEQEDPDSLPNLFREVVRQLGPAIRGEACDDDGSALDLTDIAESLVDHGEAEPAP